MKELKELVDRYDVSCHCGAVDVRPKQDGHLVMYSDYVALKQRAEAAEEKLAELEKQEPELWEIENPGEGTYYSPHNPDENDYRHALIVREWFTRPVPAINLAELVPDYLLDALCRLDLPGVSIGDKAIIGKAIEVLRNIEEQSR